VSSAGAEGEGGCGVVVIVLKKNEENSNNASKKIIVFGSLKGFIAM